MRYFSTPGAGLATREDPDWPAPADWRKITEAQYNERKAIIAQRTANYLAGRNEDLRAKREAEYELLVEAGIPASVASRLSGHKPEEI